MISDQLRNGRFERGENPQTLEVFLTPFIQAVRVLQCCMIIGVIV